MILDPEHVVAMATDLVLNQARSVPRSEIEALVREQFTGLDHVDRAILADQVTELIATATLTLDVAAPESASFWPPQVGDVWLGQLDEPYPPKAWVCEKPGMLSGIHNWTDEETYREFGPLRLVWRDGAVVTAMHSSELPPATP